MKLCLTSSKTASSKLQLSFQEQKRIQPKYESHPYSFEPVDLVVEQHLGVWQVDVTVVGVVKQMSEQREVVPCVFGSLFGCALDRELRTG